MTIFVWIAWPLPSGSEIEFVKEARIIGDTLTAIADPTLKSAVRTK